MTAKKDAPAQTGGKETVVAATGDTKLVLQDTADTDANPQKAGEAGPPSSLETGKGSPTGAGAGGEHDFEGRRGDAESKGQDYDVQCHTDEKGVFVERVHAESGDDAANQALKKHGYKGISIRGVTPASDPDPNSLGGERDASIMISKGEEPGDLRDPLGTEANREATEKLAKGDIEELGE